MANDQFPPEIVEILSRDFFLNPGAIQMALTAYESLRGNCPDAPEVKDLTPSDVFAVISVNNYDDVNKETWQEFVARKTKMHVERGEAHDPFLANWNSKTEDKLTPWVSDTGQLAPEYQEAINRALRYASPVAGENGHGTNVGSAPSIDTDVVMDVVSALSVLSPFIAEGMG